MRLGLGMRLIISMCTLDDFHQPVTVTKEQLEQVEII